MFTLPITCLLLMVSGQPGAYDTIESPAVLISYGEKALLAGDLNEIEKVIRPMERMLAKTNEKNQKENLKFILRNLKNFQRLENAKKDIVLSLNPEVDPDLTLAIGFAAAGVVGGKESFLDSRGVVEAALKKPFKTNPINQSYDFLLRKALVDIDRLTELEKDPAKRLEVTNLFLLLEGKYKLEEFPQDEKNQTGFLINQRKAAAMAARLFGPASFICYQKLDHTFQVLVNECRWGKMTHVDLASEIEKEFAPFVQAGWSDQFIFRLHYLKPLAAGCLTEKGRNHERLLVINEELESLLKSHCSPDSVLLFLPISNRMELLVQQGRHAECIQEFEKIKPSKIIKIEIPYNKINLYLSAAQAYDALGKKELALVNQELVFSVAQEIPLDAKFLGDFKKKVAKDLRDMYARNKRMKDARNLEERCQLMGLGFEPLPKQPGE